VADSKDTRDTLHLRRLANHVTGRIESVPREAV
jgi:hypothetical protein